MTMDARKQHRRDYWNGKYVDPQWSEDIHFALFPKGTPTKQLFLRGIANNTLIVSQEIQEIASIYRLSTDFRVLDFGCGAGDLLINLAKMLPVTMTGHGIDIAESAIKIATARATNANLKDRLIFHAGELEMLDALVGESLCFDVIICRDVYYLLDEREQKELWVRFARLLRPSGVVYVADLAVEPSIMDAIRPLLLDRQWAGSPISWTRCADVAGCSFSIVDQARTAGFEVAREPDLVDDAVANSYESAVDVATEQATKRAFRGLSTVARMRVNGTMAVPYVRFFFRRTERSTPKSGDFLGLAIAEDYKVGHGRLLLRAGEWKVPLSKWSLVLGRSGVGKTTLLRLLSGFVKRRSVKVIGHTPSSIFLLEQNPNLIEQLSVEDNVYLFARDAEHADMVLDALGLGNKRMRDRKADHSLSGGEWQRVALGQAISSAPDLLLLDEPGTGIDRIRKFQFFSSLKENLVKNAQGQSTTVICVDHEFLQIAEFFDSIFEILDGRLICLKS
jgi:putative hydroxymethylpyrimidine transport system ATP-binding protein